MENTKQKKAAPASTGPPAISQTAKAPATSRSPKRKKGMVLGLLQGRLIIGPDFFDEHERPPGWKPAAA